MNPTSNEVSGGDSALFGLFAAVVVIVLVFLTASMLALQSELPPYLPRPQAVDATGLTDQEGRPVALAGEPGRASVVAFFFTRCNQSCPLLMEAMRRLHGDLGRHGIQFVAVSVESQHDTVAVLRDYAARQNANWRFLTGDPTRVRAVAGQLAVGIEEDPTQPLGRHISHSNRLFVLNPEGKPIAAMEVVQRLEPTAVESAFYLDEAALRRVKLAALDAGATLIRPSLLPHVNCALNGGAGLLLLAGWFFIRRKMPKAHAAAMLSAVAVSAFFLASYLYYHWFAGDTKFSGTGSVRIAYFAILISHVVLAVVTVPLVLLTLWRAFRGQFDRHRRIARWTLAIWLYVSVTGVLVYLFLYQWFAA